MKHCVSDATFMVARYAFRLSGKKTRMQKRVKGRKDEFIFGNLI
jgi:hypothetical protein